MTQTNSKLGESPKPLETESQINQIRAYLNDRPRDLLLFELSIQTGIPMKRLLSLKMSDLAGTGVGDRVSMGSDRGAAPHFFIVTQSLYRVWETYPKQMAPSENDYLFKSRKGNGHISSQSVGRLVKTWAAAINLKGNYGAHTLRKTWGYHQRVNHGVGFEILCKRYNHSSPSITMGYLGIESKEVYDILMNEIG